MKHLHYILLSLTLLALLVACEGNSAPMPATSMPSVASLDDSQLQFVSMEDIHERLTANMTPPLSANPADGDRAYTESSIISPDAQRIIFPRAAIGSHMLCTYQIVADVTTCTEAKTYGWHFYGRFWSADGRYLASSNDKYTLRIRPDILIYDTQANTLMNISERGHTVDESGLRTYYDVANTFASNGDLYFFRNSDVMRIRADAITGTSLPKLVFSLQFDGIAIKQTDRTMLDGRVSISPDGQYMAFSETSSYLPDDHLTKGVWIIDLTQGTAKIHLPYDRLLRAEGLPVWWSEMFIETGIHQIVPFYIGWSADSDHLVLLDDNPFLTVPLRYTLSTDTLVALYDYATIPEDVSLAQTTWFDDTSLLADSMLIWSVLSPTKNTLFYLGQTDIEGVTVLSALDLTASEFTTPRRLATLDMLINPQQSASIGYNGEVVYILTNGDLITLKEE